MSQREAYLVEGPCQELSEDHLGAALIKPGDSVIIKMKRHVDKCDLHAIRVEPR